MWKPLQKCSHINVQKLTANLALNCIQLCSYYWI